MQTLFVNSYAIHVGDCWEALNAFLDRSDYSRLFVLVDEHTAEDCLPIFLEKISIEVSSVIRMPAGEQHKHLDSCRLVWEGLLDGQADRKALLINLGGGVVGDLGGFCAGTFKRGIDFIQMPTSLLAQVDASIGGKLGFDLKLVKNAIGLFQDPAGVFIYPPFLNTLPLRELHSGFAEMVKHGLIADASYWELLSGMEDLNPERISPYILRSLALKKEVVLKDPKEQGLRKVLNFGHTIGHAVESWFLGDSSPLLHGEAIAIGMIGEAFLSFKAGMLPVEDLEEIAGFMKRTFPLKKIPEAAFPDLLDLMQKDKKNVGDSISFSLIGPLGKAHVDQACSTGEIFESLVYFNSL